MVEEFLGLPMRPAKPRERGWTHVIDKGMSLPEVQGMIDTAGDYVDIVKMGWGTSYVTQNLTEKIRVYQSAGIPVMCGGTLLEAAIARGRVEDRQAVPALVDVRGLHRERQYGASILAL